MRIAVYAIAKDEAAFVQRCIESAAAADLFVLVDTGSTDGTQRLAEEAGAHVHEICISPWRFDHARNAALALVPRDVDVCVSIDIDEVMLPGWREEIERAFAQPGVNRMRYLFDCGNGVIFAKDNIHARSGFYWKHPCHEALASDPRTVECYGATTQRLMLHQPDQTKSRAQYLPLLEASTKESSSDARNAYYFGRELTFHRRWQEAVLELERYLALPTATWPAERASAERMLGDAYEALGKRDEALAHYRRGVIEAPERREPWVALADAYRRREAWHECRMAALTALQTGEALRNQWPTDADAWGAKPHDIMALASWYSGDKVSARRYGEQAAALAPDDARLQQNLAWYRSE